MGGNAVPNTRRVPAKEYHILAEEVENLLKTTVNNGCRANAIPGYRLKEDFGDIDVLIDSDGVSPEESADSWKSRLAAAGVNELFTNGKKTSVLNIPGPISFNQTYSFSYKGVQVDCIFTKPELYEAAYNYYSWNDLGNLLGRIVHKFGLKLGHEGLVYVYRPEKDHAFSEISVSTDWSSILPFFGWDYSRFEKGFGSLRDIFEFVASTPYFNPDVFLFDNRNAKGKIRDRKRKTYNMFLDWCQTLIKPPSGWHQFMDKGSYLNQIQKSFPTFSENLGNEVDRYREQQAFKFRFNGDVISKVSGLSGKDLGYLMVKIKNSEPDFQKWVLEHSDLELGIKIDKYL